MAIRRHCARRRCGFDCAPSPVAPQPMASAAGAVAGAASGFVSLPDGPLLRIAALADLGSGFAMAASSGAARDTTTAALGVLRQAIGRAKEEHRAAAHAVEKE